MQSTRKLIMPRHETPALKPRVLGIGGSPRKGGNSDVLLKTILQGVAQSRMEHTSVQLRNLSFQGCIGCEKCRQQGICTGLHDGMSLLYPEILSSRGLILVCPVHNYNITSWMKAFIDRLYCFYIFQDTRPRQWSSALAGQDRKAVLAAVCEQEDASDMGFAMEAMARPLTALGYEIRGELPVFGIFDRAKVAENKGVLASARSLGESLAQAVRHSDSDRS